MRAWCWFLVDDKTAEEFAGYMKKFPDLYVYLSSVVEKFTTGLHPVILDLGAGPGLLSAQLCKRFADATVIGLDPLVSMLVMAQKNVGRPDVSCFEAVQGVSERLPFQSESFDVVVSRFSLPYWPQPAMSFAEMYRVVKPNGVAVLEALNRDFPRWKLFGIKLHMMVNQAGFDMTKYHVDAYKNAYTIEQVEELFSTAGFRVIEKEGKKSEWKFILVAQKH